MALTFTCTAYQLLTQYGRNVDVGDWFASFCLALGAPAAAGADGAGRGNKKRRAPKKKRKMKTVERSVQGAAAEDAAAGDGQPAVRLLSLQTSVGRHPEFCCISRYTNHPQKR